MNSVVSEKKFIQERLGIPYENLSQSYLRAENRFATNGATVSVSQVIFNLQRGQVATPVVTENLLDLNDQFVITHFRLSLKLLGVGSTSGVPTVATATQELTPALQFYPDPAIFGAVATSNLQAIYNGNISFTIDRKQFLPAFPANAFYRVPTSQTGFITGQTAATPTYANAGLNGYDNGLFGFYVSEPTLIDGRQTLDLSLNLGATVAFGPASTTSYVAVFETRGYLVVNAKS
jgi:hypothetical protein